MKTVQAQDYFGNTSTFIICYETSVLHEWFAVGVDTVDMDEVSIFHVTNDGRKDNYRTLDTCFWNVYQKYGYSFEDKFKKEIAKVLKDVLTKRVSCGMLTVEQIKGWLK